MKRFFHLLIAFAIFFVCTPVFASEPSFLSEWTGISDASLAVISSMVLLGGPIAGNAIAHLFLRLGWVKASALVARWTPFATRAASVGLRAPTLGQAARAVIEEAKKEPDLDAPISTAAMHLQAFVKDDLTPILEAADPPKKPETTLPSSFTTTLIMLGAVMGFVVLTAVLGGCGAKQDLEKALDTSVVIIDRAEPCFVGMQQDELAQCEPDNAECIARVKDRWAPVADALDAYRAFLCGISPDAEGCR
jgi:hypothetical protein